MPFIAWFSSFIISRSITHFLFSISVNFVVTFIHFLSLEILSFVHLFSLCSITLLPEGSALFDLFTTLFLEPSASLDTSLHSLRIFWVNEHLMK